MVARRFDQYGPGGVILPLGGAGVSAWPPAGGGSDDGGGQRISGTNLSSVVALAPRKRRGGPRRPSPVVSPSRSRLDPQRGRNADHLSAIYSAISWRDVRDDGNRVFPLWRERPA